MTWEKSVSWLVQYVFEGGVIFVSKIVFVDYMII